MPYSLLLQRSVLLFITLFALLAAGIARSQPPPTIAIIIDDLGNHEQMGDRLIAIPTPLTLAFLPLRRHTKQQAQKAHQRGKEVMLHAPMENTRNIPLGAGGLSRQMSNQELLTTFRHSLRSIPFVSGVNNHMGSTLTQDRRAMNVLMRELKGYSLYFVDSRTTASSIAHKTAVDYKIPALTRDIFLDNNIKTKDIHRQFRKLVEVARTNGTAIAIGHPHLRTVRYLERMLPKLGKEGIAVATVGGIWAIRNNAREMFSADRPHHPSLVAQSVDELLERQIN